MALIAPPSIANGVRVVGLGDSITAPTHVDQYMLDIQRQLLGLGVVVDIREFGYPFQNADVIRTHVPDALAAVASNPGGSNVLIVESTTNDLLHSVPLIQTTSDYNGTLSDIRADPRGANIAVFCLPIFCVDETYNAGFQVGEPATTNINTMIQAAAANWGCHYVDTRSALAAAEAFYNVPAPGVAQGLFTYDKVHPNARGTSIMAAAIIAKWMSLAPLVPGGYADTHIKWLVTERAASTALAQAAGTTFGNSEWSTDFVDGKYASTAANGGTAPMSTTLPGGVLLLTTAAANASVFVHPATKAIQVANLLTGTYYAYWKGRFTVADAGATHLVGLTAPGLNDNAAGIAFGVVGATSTTKFCTVTNAGAGNTATATATNIDTAADHEVRVFGNAGVASWYLDGVLVATQNLTAGNVGASTAAMVTARGRNPADATSRVLNLDRMIVRT